MTHDRAYSFAGIILCLSLGFWLGRGLVIQMAPSISGPAFRYVTESAEETGASNVVASILFDYRGFDTLGEATVIYATVCGIALIFSGHRLKKSGWGLSFIVKRSMDLMVPFMLIYASSIVAMGHITPGGGFQGGAILATVTVLLCVIYGSRFESSLISPTFKEAAESSGALLFMAIGFWGLAQGAGFLANLHAGFPRGALGGIFSAGSIPLLNLAVAMKVGAGLSTIFFSMVKILDDPDDGSSMEE